MPKSRRHTPYDNIIRGVYLRPSDTDPCGCSEVCDHGEQCLGGHALSPNDHWYLCDVCTPKDDRLCKCGDPRSQHASRCRVPLCGCREFRPKGTVS